MVLQFRLHDEHLMRTHEVQDLRYRVSHRFSYSVLGEAEAEVRISLMSTSYDWQYSMSSSVVLVVVAWGMRWPVQRGRQYSGSNAGGKAVPRQYCRRGKCSTKAILQQGRQNEGSQHCSVFLAPSSLSAAVRT
jgi:hypothetical protein